MGRVVRERVGLMAAVLASLPMSSAAQSANQFGALDRARAAEKMVVVAVQQGISALPPTSGQSFFWTFDPEISTYVSSDRLGPTAFRSPEGNAAGRFSFRLATSYFELSDTFRPVDYRIDGPLAEERLEDNGLPIDGGLTTRFGLDLDVEVFLMDLSMNYGMTDRVEVSVNFPLVTTHASAAQTTIVRPDAATPQPHPVEAVPRDAPKEVLDRPCSAPQTNGSCLLDQFLALPDADPLAYRYERNEFSHIGVPFADGTNFGLGRPSLTMRIRLMEGRLQAAFAPSLFFRSPSEDELAGSESFAILPRIVGSFDATSWAQLLMDIGYDYDFDERVLRRFVWNSGVSLAPFKSFAFDVGFGGAEFQEGIAWTPERATFRDSLGTEGTLTLESHENNELGTSFIDLLTGIKVRLGDRVVASATLVVPLTNDGVRPTALGNLALEYLW